VLWISGKLNDGYAWMCSFEEVFTEIAWKGSEKMTKLFAKDRV